MKYIVLFLLLLYATISDAQLEGQPLIDSVLKDLKNAKEDSNKIKLLNVLAFNYKSIDPNEGIKYSRQQLELSSTLGLKKGVISAYNLLGLNYQYKSDYPKALEYYNKALLALANTPNATAGYGSVISNIAVIYEAMGDYNKAEEFHFKSLEINKKLDDSFNIGGDYGNLGINYFRKKNFEKALEYDLKSLDMFQRISDKSGIAHNYGNIGNVYKELKNYPKALEYDMQALALFEELGESGGIAMNTGNIGGVYIAIAKDMDTVRQPGMVLPAGTKSYFLGKAEEYLLKGIALSRKIGQPDNIIEFNQGLYEVYLMKGNYKAAHECYKEYMSLKESVYSEDNKLQLERLETEREIALKDKEIEIDKLKVVQKRNERIIYIIALALLVIVIVIIIKRLQSQTLRNSQLSKEKVGHLAKIEKQESVLDDIAHTHSHEVSGQVATILGLVSVFNRVDYSDPDNKTVIDGIADTAVKLDGIVKDMIILENKLDKQNDQGQ